MSNQVSAGKNKQNFKQVPNQLQDGGVVTTSNGTLDYANGQLKAYSGTTSQFANAFTANRVLIQADSDCFINVGSNPSAVTTGASLRIPADLLVEVDITSGDKIAIIQSSFNGTAYAIPFTVVDD